eukprot:jgi/Orpsp1_1/1181229/evm.model.c7180000076374.1
MFGAPMDEEGNCDYKYACFLPTGATTILPNAILAKDPSECIKIKGNYYCSADLNNYDCPDCTFPQFVQKVYETFGERFDYEDIDLSEVTTPIVVPTATTSTTATVSTVTSDSTPTTQKSTKVVIPWRGECPIAAEETPEQTDCNERDGFFMFGAPMDEEGNCEYRYACFLPTGATKIFPNAILAKDPSECIKIKGNYYCSADLNNYDCPDCTFPQFVQKVYESFGERFDYEDIDLNEVTTPITVPTETSENIKCATRKSYGTEGRNCEIRDGLFLNEAFYPDCDKKRFACFLPEGKKITKNAVAAQNPSECIVIDGKTYCSIDYTNISCPEGKETCTFSELLQEISGIYGDYFSYEAPSNPPKTVTPTPSAHPNRPQVINTDFCSVSNYEYEFYKPLQDCDDRDGKFIYGAPVDDDGNCVKLYACFLPEGTENLHSGAMKAQNSSECIIMNDERYCAADLNNFDCPDCTFTQFVEKVYVNLGEENFSYEEDSSLSPSTTVTTNSTPTSQKSTKVVIPWRGECPIAAEETPEQTDCSERNGFFMFGAPLDEEGNCEYRYACFLPTGATKIFPNAYLAKDPSECIKIKGKYYCSADLNNYDCPDCTFPQFVQKVYESFGERFNYEDIDLNEVTTPITVPTETTKNIKCATREIYGTEGRNCKNRNGLFLNEAFYPDCDKKRFACFLPEGKKITKNAVAAQDPSECIVIHGKTYCSIDYTNISCPEGKETCTFSELLQEISGIYGDYFSYEAPSNPPKTVTPTPSAHPNRPQVINTDFCSVSNYEYEFYSSLMDCEDRDGEFIYGAPVDDDGNCVKLYACFLPE